MDKRLHSRLTNPQNLIMPSYRINKDWKQEEARIISEQAQKDALQKQATQEAAWAIANLERQEAERNPWIAASKMTAIQGVDGASSIMLPKRDGDIYTLSEDVSREKHNINRVEYGNMFKKVSDTYANPYGNQRANLSSIYGEERHWYDAPTDEGKWVQNLAGDKVEWKELEKYRDAIMSALISKKETVISLGFAITIESAILMVEKRISIELRNSAMALMLELTVCQALVIAADKWGLLVNEYMRKHNCSREEAEENRMLLEPFVLETIRVYLEYFVGFVLQTFAIPNRLSGVIKGILSWFLSSK